MTAERTGGASVWRRHFWTALKLALSVGMVAAVASFYDVSGLARRLHDVQLLPAMACVAVLAAQIVLVAYRWRKVASAYEISAAWPRMLRFTFVGQFFSQLLPSSVGGDAVKGWLLYRDGIALRRVVQSVIADRVVGIVCLLLLVALVIQTPRAAALSTSVMLPLALVLAGGLTGVGILLSLPALSGHRYLRWPLATFVVELAAGLRIALGGYRRAARLFGIALLVHVCSIAAAAAAARAVGVELEPGVLMVVFPITMLSATIPVTIGGWGVREGVLVGLLGSYAVPAEGALALSIVYGLALALASLPGAALWFGSRRGERVSNDEIDQAWQSSMGASPTKE